MARLRTNRKGHREVATWSPHQMQSSIIAEPKFGALQGKGNPPIADWWHHSNLRILADEICSFPLRIWQCLHTPNLSWGHRIPPYPKDRYKGDLALKSTFVRACGQDILLLRNKHRWACALDLEMAAEAYRAGAAWAIDNFCNCESSKQLDSSLKTPLV